MESDSVSFSCDECDLEATSACEDCVVTFLLDPPVRRAIVVDVAEARAVRLLAGAGLVPELRFRRRVS